MHVGATRKKTCLGIILVLFALFLAFGMTGCSGCDDQQQEESETEKVSLEQAADAAGVSVEEVEAVVNGKVVTHEDVDVRVQRMRSVNGLSDDEAFSDFLDSAGISAQDYRREALKELIDEVLIVTNGEDLGVTVSYDELDAQIEQLESRYPSHAAFVSALNAAGYTTESYYNAVWASILSSRLREKVISDIEPTEEEVREYAQMVAPTLAGRRSSQILLPQSGSELAQELWERLQDGEDFESLARTYSIDGSSSQGGDMGWESMTSMPEEYKEALDKLDVGEISPVVHSDFGYHIILCTDIYEPSYDEDGNIIVEDIPEDLMEEIKQSMISLLSEAEYDRYVSNLEATAALAVYDEDGNQISPEDVGLATEVVDVSISGDDAAELVAADASEDGVASSDSPSDLETAPAHALEADDAGARKNDSNAADEAIAFLDSLNLGE
jgi:foldase protein PrsA